METDRSARYLAEMSDAEIQRLLTLAALGAQHVKTSCLRAGLTVGMKALDVGCGALGAMKDLAELVGPTGAVVGIDNSADALASARTVVDRLDLPNIKVVLADANEVAPEEVCPPGPFDLAYVRFFLVHQADPAATLRNVARLLRPGAKVIVHEPFRSVYVPPHDPLQEPLALAQGMIFDVIGAGGGSPDIATRMSEVALAAALELTYQFGISRYSSVKSHVSFVAASLRAGKKAIVAFHHHTEQEVDAAAEVLDGIAATDGGMMLTGPLIAAELTVAG